MKYRLKRFFYQTFRPHSKAEYAELFTRGSGGKTAPYPWFYARVLLAGLILFAAVCIGYSLSGLNFPTVIAAGGVIADLAFIVLLFELCPKRDVSLALPLIVFFAGGLLSTALCDAVYGFANYRAPFAAQAWIAFVEETSKALVTVVFLLILKRRDALFCLIIGAAVGGGYSAFENMWYMYTDGFVYYYNNLSPAMTVALFRALGTPFSHAAWAAAFGWALGGAKPYKKWQPYAVFAFNYTMHFFVNFPTMAQFAGWKGYPISAVTGVLSFCLLIYIIRLSVKEARGQTEPEKEVFLTSAPPKTRAKFRANVFAAAALIFLAAAMIGPTCVYGGYLDYKFVYYDNFGDCVGIVHMGNDFCPDYKREYVPYDDLSQNYSYTVQEGELVSVVQRQRYGDFDYYFSYIYFPADENIEFSDDTADGAEAEWVLQYVELDFYGKKYQPGAIHLPDGSVLHYFNVNPDVFGLYYTEGKFRLQIRANNHIRGLASVIFTSAASAGALACGTAYAIIKIKIKRRKYDGLCILQDNSGGNPL